MKNNKFLYVLYFLLIIGCSSNSEDDLTNPVVLGTTKYNQDVKSIIDNNCNSCHGATPTNGAPMPLVTYAQVKDAMQNRGLLDRISRTQGSAGMMPVGGARLPQTSINLISDWNADGLLE